VLQNRLLFLRNLKSAISHMQSTKHENELYDSVIKRLRCPKFMDFKMPDTTCSAGEIDLEEVKEAVK
jgi:hypothetical protein